MWRAFALGAKCVTQGHSELLRASAVCESIRWHILTLHPRGTVTTPSAPPNLTHKERSSPKANACPSPAAMVEGIQLPGNLLMFVCTAFDWQILAFCDTILKEHISSARRRSGNTRMFRRLTPAITTFPYHKVPPRGRSCGDSNLKGQLCSIKITTF
jgi:hypothetical protein